MFQFHIPIKNPLRVKYMASADKNSTSSLRYYRGSIEFSRLLNLGDAVFAIAMTLLVLTLDTPQVSSEKLASTLVNQMPQFIAFLISFALVANIWWQHHKLFQMINSLDSVLIFINLVIFGAVVLVPFPTSLIGNNPNSSLAVIFFVILFALLNFFFLIITIRVNKIKAWNIEINQYLYFWLLFQYIGGVLLLTVACIISIWLPVVGLAIIAAGTLLGPLFSGFSYKSFIQKYEDEL